VGEPGAGGRCDRAPVCAEGKDVVIIGGGDTGADCLGTAHRRRARSVAHVDIRSRPPEQRTRDMPWPTYPAIYRDSCAHEEGGIRLFCVDTVEFVGDAGRLRAIRLADGYRDDRKQFHRSGEVAEPPAQLALLALGFSGP
jgi:glutamate synthase (NADPH/NADH) small chain